MPGHSYKGDASAAGRLTLWPPAVASSPTTDNLTWTAGSGAPGLWAIFTGPSPAGPWTLQQSVPGSANNANGLPGGLYAYVQGVAADHSPQTKPSGPVQITSIYPAPIVTVIPGGSISWTNSGPQPAQWVLLSYPDDTPYDTADGSQSTYDGLEPGDSYILYGADGNGSATTAISLAFTAT